MPVKSKHLFFVLGLATSFGIVPVHAQGPAIAAPSQNWSYINHSSTLGEGLLRGQAATLSAAGEAIYMDSLAAVNYAEAYKRAIENSVAVTKAYYERREIREEYMQKYGPKPFVGEARRRFLEYYQPKRLSAQEFDAKTGKLAWPHILRQEQFAPLKVQVDEVFTTREPENSGDGSSTHRQVYQLCNLLNALLKDNISSMTADQYIAGQEFLRSVELEAKNVVVPGVRPEDKKAAEEPIPEVKLNPGTPGSVIKPK